MMIICYTNSFLNKLVHIILFFFHFVKEVTNPICYKTIEQPTSSTLKESIISSSGPLVTYRAFKHGKRSSRSITEAEHCQAAESLQEDGFGRIVEFRVPRATENCKVFIKSKPEPYHSTAVISSAAFDDAFSKAIHKDMHYSSNEGLSK